MLDFTCKGATVQVKPKCKSTVRCCNCTTEEQQCTAEGWVAPSLQTLYAALCIFPSSHWASRLPTSNGCKESASVPHQMYRFPVITFEFVISLKKSRCTWEGGSQGRKSFHILWGKSFHITGERQKIILYTDNSKKHSTFHPVQKNGKYFMATTQNQEYHWVSHTAALWRDPGRFC